MIFEHCDLKSRHAWGWVKLYKYNSVLLKILVATICINSFNTLIFADSSSQAAITPISQESLLTSEDSGEL